MTRKGAGSSNKAQFKKRELTKELSCSKTKQQSIHWQKKKEKKNQCEIQGKERKFIQYKSKTPPQREGKNGGRPLKSPETTCSDFTATDAEKSGKRRRRITGGRSNHLNGKQKDKPLTPHKHAGRELILNKLLEETKGRILKNIGGS